MGRATPSADRQWRWGGVQPGANCENVWGAWFARGSAMPPWSPWLGFAHADARPWSAQVRGGSGGCGGCQATSPTCSSFPPHPPRRLRALEPSMGSGAHSPCCIDWELAPTGYLSISRAVVSVASTPRSPIHTISGVPAAVSGECGACGQRSELRFGYQAVCALQCIGVPTPFRGCSHAVESATSCLRFAVICCV